MSKAAELLPKMVEVKNKTEALEVLYQILQSLHLTNNYTDLVKIKDELEEKKTAFHSITDAYGKSEKTLQTLMDYRQHLSFLYRDVVDQFSFKINKN